MRWRFTINPDTDNLVISEPIGWAKIEFELVRDAQWHGVFFEYSLPLEFYDDPTDATRNAYTLIQEEYDAQGIDGSLILKVEMACNDTDAFTEEAQWKMNFTSYKEKRGRLCTVELSLEPENVLMTFRNRYNQKFDLTDNLTIDGSQLDSYTGLGSEITIPPVGVLQIATLNSPEGGSEQVFPDLLETDEVLSGIGTAEHNFIMYAQYGCKPGYGLSFDEPNNLDEIDSRIDIENKTTADVDEIEDLYIFTYGGEYTIVVTLQARIEIDIVTEAENDDCGDLEDTFTNYDIKARLVVGGVTYNLYSEVGTDCYTGGVVITSIPVFEVSNTITVNAGDEMKLYVRAEASGVWKRRVLSAKDINWTGKFTGTAKVEISAVTKKDASAHKMYLINEVGSRILEGITDDGFRLLSNYYGRTDSQPYASPNGLDGAGSLRGLTIGLLLRNYENLKQLTHSFEEFFKALNAVDNVGIGLETDPERAGYEVVRMEPMEYFYEDTVMLTIDHVPMVEITPMMDRMANKLVIGYDKYAMEEYYGLDEFNTTREYRHRTKATDSELKMTCPWIASGLAVEITRRKEAASLDTLQDWKFDNNTFMICLERSGYALAVEQGNITDAAGFVDETSILNYRISPARNALRWLKHSLLTYRNPDALLSTMTFVDGTGNFTCEGFMTGDNPIEAGTLIENETLRGDKALGDAGLPVYVPEIWKFDFPMTLADYTAVKAIKRGKIRASFGQSATYYSFYIHKIKYRPNQGIATFELIPEKLYPIDECCIYMVTTIGDGTASVGSSTLSGAAIENLFIFVNGKLLKYNDANDDNNEIESFSSATGYATLGAVVNIGIPVLILHIPDMAKNCNPCILHFEGTGNGTNSIVLTGFEGVALSSIAVFYNGELLKWNDTNTANNEIAGWTAGSATLTINGILKSGREVRAWAFEQCGS